MKAIKILPVLVFLAMGILLPTRQVLGDQKFTIKSNEQKVGEEIIYQRTSKKDPSAQYGWHELFN